MPKEHDVVAPTANRLHDGLRIGDVGAVVHCYRDPGVFEIESIGEQARTKCVATVPDSQIMKLNLLPLPA